MVTYNPKDWFKLIFRFHKSDTIRILFPTMVLLGILTGFACYAEEKYLTKPIPTLTIFHQISGFIISLVLVFRINTGYDRWWEGRKLWGSMLNNARNLAIKFNSIIPDNELQLRKDLSDLISNYAFSVKDHLRNDKSVKNINFNDQVAEPDFIASVHRPNFVAKILMRTAYNACSKHGASNDFLIVSKNIGELTDICGGCERIKNTPIPYSYSIFIKKFMFLYIITMPFSFGLTVGYWSVPIVMIMFYAFASLELLSEEIEDPFGTDENDLPTDEISAKVRQNVEEILLNNGR